MELFDFRDYSRTVQKQVNGILQNRGVNTEELKRNCDALIEHGKRTKDYRLLGFAYFFRAENEFIQNRNDEFFRYIMSGLQYMDSSGQWELMARSYNLMGITSINRGNAPFAMDYYLTSLKYCTIHALDEIGVIVNINIGMLYMEFNDYQQGMRYFESALGILNDRKDISGRESLMFSAYIGLAGGCLLRRDLMQGRNFMSLAKSEGKIENDPVSLLVYHCFEARIFDEEKKFSLRDEAIEEVSKLIEQEIPLIDIFEDIFRYAELLLNIERYEELWVVLEKLEHIIKRANLRHLEKRILSLKIKYYKNFGDRAGYLQAAGLYYEISDMMEKENSFMVGKMLDIRSFLEESAKKQKQMKEQNRELQMRSETDPLTGLSNRFRLQTKAHEAFEHALQNGSCFAIEILDVDYFKGFNDNYGHQAGDECIKSVANQIGSMMGQSGVFAARYGGDEFVLIYEGYPIDQVEELMKELREKIIGMNMKHEYSKAAPYVTISQGGCFGIPAEGEKVESYLHTADDMLYRIKEVSRNSYQVCEYGKENEVKAPQNPLPTKAD